MKKFTIVILCCFVLCFGLVVYRCSHNENMPYYGDDNYYHVTAWVNRGRECSPYCGVVSIDDYQKWVNGDDGSIFIYKANRKGFGNRVSISSIVSIENYGSAPDWLPMNFW